jgi:hypothetical protein
MKDLLEIIRYRFDTFMSMGTLALIAGLGVLSFTVVFLAALILAISGISYSDQGPLNFVEAVWVSLMRTLDPGTMGDDTGWYFRLVMLTVTLCGLFFVSALIGILTSGLEDKLAKLRKGRSRVVEQDHTVILGWSRRIYSILGELSVAYAHRRRLCVVVLGEKDRIEMEEQIAQHLPNLRNVKVVCRNGSSIDSRDISLTNPNASRSIIILGPDNSDDADTCVIKTLLAITNSPDRRPSAYHLVAEIRNPQNMAVANLASRGEAELVFTGELIARVVAQTCRQKGLSGVYTELLDFGGDEIYFAKEPRLAGMSFGEALLHFRKSTVIGIRCAQESPVLNPPKDQLLKADDDLILISENEILATQSFTSSSSFDEELIIDSPQPPPLPEKTLILGWNWRAPLILRELDNYVAKGSEVLVVAEDGYLASDLQMIAKSQRNQTVSFKAGGTSDRAVLDCLDISKFQHVIVLSYSDDLDPQKADAKTLATLLHLRDISEKSKSDFSIVSEMLDERNRQLAQSMRIDDFIVSEQLVSLLLTQISENKELNVIFQDLFDADGSEIYMKPVQGYIKLGHEVDFNTVVESAKRKGHIAIGYRLANADIRQTAVINPDKAAKIQFNPGDVLVVIAPD